MCRDGNYFWREYCLEKKLKINQCGKLVVARNESELKGLDELYRRGQENSVKLEVITENQAKEIEPSIFKQDKAKEVRYKRNKEFTDEVAEEFLNRKYKLDDRNFVYPELLNPIFG